MNPVEEALIQIKKAQAAVAVLAPSRETSLAKTKLDEAYLWLGGTLNQEGKPA
jgi:hypothetical protein